LGWPKSCEGYGYGGFIVPEQKRVFCSGKGSSLLDVQERNSYSIPELTKLAKRDTNLVFQDLVPYYANKDSLVYAYELIKSNPGNMTPGVTKETLDGIDLDWFAHIQTQLLRGTYKFKDIRRVHIPKKKGSKETRPLGVSSPRDKVVQKVLE
jgi:RNA-directed DNA polymerase